MFLKKFKSRIWTLRHLKQNGFTNSNLVLVYKSMIRPLVEYCSSVYHSLITTSDSLELAKQMSESAHYMELFPLNPERRPGLRTREKYKIYTATTSRYMNSPLNSMRHFLNTLHKS